MPQFFQPQLKTFLYSNGSTPFEFVFYDEKNLPFQNTPETDRIEQKLHRSLSGKRRKVVLTSTT